MTSCMDGNLRVGPSGLTPHSNNPTDFESGHAILDQLLCWSNKMQNAFHNKLRHYKCRRNHHVSHSLNPNITTSIRKYSSGFHHPRSRLQHTWSFFRCNPGVHKCSAIFRGATDRVET
jgi:hypothetical protein